MYIDKNIIYIIILCLIFLTICLLYGKYRCNNVDFEDPFQYKIGIGDLDGWSMIHIGEYIVLGYLFPDYFYFIMLIGLLWEMFEFYYEFYKPNWLEGNGHCVTTDNDDRLWWYGKVSDIFCNILGFIVGMHIKNKYK